MIPIAGPPCFLQHNLNELNYRENKKSIFFDNWDVPEFNLMKQVYRTLPGDRYTFTSLKDIKDSPFDKEEFINNNLYNFNYNISDDKIRKIDKKIISLFSNILSNNIWLGKYIKCKIYLNK